MDPTADLSVTDQPVRSTAQSTGHGSDTILNVAGASGAGKLYGNEGANRPVGLGEPRPRAKSGRLTDPHGDRSISYNRGLEVLRISGRATMLEGINVP